MWLYIVVWCSADDFDAEPTSTSMLQLDCAPTQQLALGLVAARHMSPPAPPTRREATRVDGSRATDPQVPENSSSSGQEGHPQAANSLGITGAS